MREQFYKVLTRSSETGDFFSALIINPVLRTKYSLREWTYPKVPNTPLMVFGSLRAARNFCELSGSDQGYIFRCKALNPQRCCYTPRGTEVFESAYPDNAEEEQLREKVQKGWADIMPYVSSYEHILTLPVALTPFNSYSCDAVMITSLVYPRRLKEPIQEG